MSLAIYNDKGFCKVCDRFEDDEHLEDCPIRELAEVKEQLADMVSKAADRYGE